MSLLGYASDEGHLNRYNTLSTSANTPGQERWVHNKSADQTTIVNPENLDGTGHWEIWAYNATGSALTAGYWYDLTAPSTDGSLNPSVAAIGTGANTALRRAVVATKATAAATWGWFAFSGVVDTVGTVGTTDIAAGDYLKFDVDTALAYAVIKDGTAETDKSVCVALAANTTDTTVTNIRCQLLNKRAVITT